VSGGEKPTGGVRKRRGGIWLRPEASSGEEFQKLVEHMAALMTRTGPGECARLLRSWGRPEAIRKRRAA
jgi:hypothetical protein